VEALAGTLTREQGEPLVKARGECRGAAHWFREIARIEIPHDVLRDDGRPRPT
jgi:acyl-CoA reductase-like NAD-dependent aldehyde dehydrogenase